MRFSRSNGGSPDWLRRAQALGFDPLTEVKTVDDLALFPNIVDGRCADI
jgi:hypothetical protein